MSVRCCAWWLRAPQTVRMQQHRISYLAYTNQKSLMHAGTTTACRELQGEQPTGPRRLAQFSYFRLGTCQLSHASARPQRVHTGDQRPNKRHCGNPDCQFQSHGYSERNPLNYGRRKDIVFAHPRRETIDPTGGGRVRRPGSYAAVERLECRQAHCESDNTVSAASRAPL